MNKKVSPPPLDERAQQVLLKTLAIVTGKWRLRILDQLAGQKRRYRELRRAIPEVSEKVLVSELNELIALGVVQKEAFREIPPRVEYELTPKGQQLIPILERLVEAVDQFLT